MKYSFMLFGRDKAMVRASHLMGIGMMVLVLGGYQAGTDTVVLALSLVIAVISCCALHSVANSYQMSISEYRPTPEDQEESKD